MGLIFDAYGRPTSPSFSLAHRWIAEEARCQERARDAAAKVRELRWSVLGLDVQQGTTITVRKPRSFVL